MFRRTFLECLSLFGMTSLATRTASADDAVRGASHDDWKGLTVLKGGKGYVQAPLGQLHYRDVGPRDDKAPMVLLHQSPMAMIEWGDVQNALADLGVRSIIVDTPGYGMSDVPSQQPYIKDYAANLLPLLDHLKLKKVIMAGHHTGSQIATSFTAQHPERVMAVVLHGSAMFSDEEAADYRARFSKFKGTGRQPKPDGSQFTSWFRPPREERQALLDAYTWLTITSFMSGPDYGHWAAFNYQMQPDVMKIKVPTLVVSDTGDEVNPMDKRLIALRPEFNYIEFSNGNFMEFMADPKRWAKIVAEWRSKTLHI